MLLKPFRLGALIIKAAACLAPHCVYVYDDNTWFESPFSLIAALLWHRGPDIGQAGRLGEADEAVAILVRVIHNLVYVRATITKPYIHTCIQVCMYIA